MESKLIFIRRTKQEEEIFGGIVYVDVDGKNIGQLSTQDLIYEIAPGKHHIKMYKSHKFDTLIGIAEEDIEVEEGKSLIVKYSAPLMVNQPGNIMISDFVSFEQINRMVQEKENTLEEEKINNIKVEKAREEASRKSNNALFLWIFVIPILFGLLWWIIEMSIIY